MDGLSHKARQGVSLFNHGQFYEAHEYFEDAWRETADDSREFYRALLHISAGFFRLSQARSEGARKFFSRGVHWLSQFTNPTFGFDPAELKGYAEALIQAIDNGQDSEAIIKAFFRPIEPRNVSTQSDVHTDNGHP